MSDDYLIDPNPEGRGNIPLEDLSIEADLHVYGRNRSFIGIDEGLKQRKIAEIKGKEVPFNRGTKYGSQFSLSTDYTDVSNNDNEGYETLGITNIDIDYNSSYMPIVNIDMVDVRGKLFQKGNKSPYSEFFNFPYPLFELKVKGYYGKPVEYLLHLTNFKSKLDSANGNFNIKCSFVGYTYAYLSDMLLGYLKAVPYTTVGSQLIKERNEEGGEFIAFEELYEFSKILNNKIINVKNNDERLESLALGRSKMNDFSDMKARIKNVLDVMKSDGPNDGLNNDGYFLFLNTIKKTTKINTVLENIKEEIIIYNENVNSDNEEFKFDPNIFKLNDSRYLRRVKKSEFLNDEGIELGSYRGDNKSLKDDLEKFNIIANKFKGVPSISDNIELDIIYLKDIFDKIDVKISLLDKLIKRKFNEFSKIFFDEASKLSFEDANGNVKQFDFNIYSYTKVLSDHVDILIKSIEEVSLRAENNDSRNKELKREIPNLTDLTNPDKYDKIYAFPEYTEYDEVDAVHKDTWIGSKYSNIDEVIFVKELYNGLIQSKVNENEYLEELIDTSTQWYSINPFDTLKYTNNENVWSSVGNTTGRDGEIFRLMAMRASIFMGYSVRNPTKMEIIKMAKLEANTLFKIIENDITKDVILNINESSLEVVDIAKTIREKISDASYELINRFEDINLSSVFRKKTVDVSGDFSWNAFWGDTSKNFLDVEQYYYIAGHNTIDNIDDLHEVNDGVDDVVDGTRFFLPLYFNGNKNRFHGDDFINSNGQLTSTEDRIKLREEGNVFFSDYMGNHVVDNDKPDDGATYIDIISSVDYKNLEANGTTYGAQITNNLITNESVHRLEGLKGDFKNMLFNGKLNNNEFMLFNDGDETLDFYQYFYNNDIHHTSFNFIKNGDEKITDFLNGDDTYNNISLTTTLFNGTKYDLFGTNFYYNQNNIFTKAYLFLFSISFRGLKNNDSGNWDKTFEKEILNLFDKKSAFIEVPHSWLLLLGGILYYNENYDMIKFIDEGGNIILLPYEETHKINDDYVDFFSLKSKKIGIVLNKLPRSVKNKFITLFTEWVDSDSGFKKIKNDLEIFTEDVTEQDRYRYWIKEFWNGEEELIIKTKNYKLERILRSGSWSSQNVLYTVNIISSLDNGIITGDKSIGEKILYIKGVERSNSSLLNINLELIPNGPAHNTLKEFLKESKVLVNSTWRIWANDLDEGEKIPGNSFPMTFKGGDMDDYLGNFVQEFKKLRNDEKNSIKNLNGEIFGGMNLDDIYLTIYKNIKSIKDKWIGEASSQFTNLIDSFNFLDRGYNDIGKEFKLNPMNVTDLLTSNYNTSFYSHISRVLNNNNFDFIAMPNFIDYSDPKEIKNLFKTYSYNENVTSSKPTFVCLYVGENSKSLDMNNNFRDDGYNIPDNVPSDLTKVPSILVRYGDENQSIFSDLELDQAEYSETNESLMVTDQIANSYNSINSIGQNIFNVYSTRAYNSTVTLLGNAMLQPFMYYQLDNVPMFRGAYIIKKVTHSITPNHMTTKMVGNRVKRIKTKLIDKAVIFSSIIGGLNNININEGSSLDSMFEENVKRENGDGTPLISKSLNPDLYEKYFYYHKKPGNEPYEEGDFSRESNTQIKEGNGFRFMTYEEIFKKVREITGISLINIKTASVVESSVGKNKGIGGFEINGSGYVGLMQFGQPATMDVRNQIEGIIFTEGINNHINYKFAANIDVINRKILIPEKITKYNWTKEPMVNTVDNNSMYDDFISALGFAFYAQKYISKDKINNASDSYLVHQQGPTGYKEIIGNPIGIISSNAKGNPPIPSEASELIHNQDWYLAWSGKLESIATSIDPNYKTMVG